MIKAECCFCPEIIRTACYRYGKEGELPCQREGDASTLTMETIEKVIGIEYTKRERLYK